MKKHFIKFVFAFSALALFSACGDREMLNSEADILDVYVSAQLKTSLPIITNTTVVIPRSIESESDKIAFETALRAVKIEFRLTKGATIISRDGKHLDFSEGKQHIFTVTSEDGKWKKDYTISFRHVLPFDKEELQFEYVEANTANFDTPYHIFYEIDAASGIRQYVWSSGNAGFAMTANKKPATDYPTFSIDWGKTGKGVQLVTRSTGSMGGGFGMPIAAGNLFLGSFDTQNATSAPLQATRFGVRTTMKCPSKITFWGKYQAGAEYKDASGNVLSITDHPDVYAVLYEPKLDSKGNPIMLDGTNATTADNIVLIAQLNEEAYETLRVSGDINMADYRQVEMSFEERVPFDVEKQENGKYYFTIVFSSSAKGAEFEGAVGSTFCADEARIITD